MHMSNVLSELLSPLTGILNWIICLVESFFYYVADGIVWAINISIAGIAAALVDILALLPDMPDLPSTPDWSPLGAGPTFSDVEGWVAWFWPVNTTVQILAFLVLAYLVWQGVSILLRWAKAINA